MVAVAPLKDAAVVAAPGGGGQRRGGRLGATPWWSRQSGGAWLVLRLANGAAAAVPRFEGRAVVVVLQTPVMLEDCRARAEKRRGNGPVRTALRGRGAARRARMRVSGGRGLMARTLVRDAQSHPPLFLRRIDAHAPQKLACKALLALASSKAQRARPRSQAVPRRWRAPRTRLRRSPRPYWSALPQSPTAARRATMLRRQSLLGWQRRRSR